MTDATDYVKVAEAFGIKGLRITCLEEVDAVLTEALNMNAPVLIDLQVGENDMVSPMIAPGGSISDALEV